MRRCTLIVVCVVVVIFLPLAANAGALQWSGGITITERTDQSGISSRLEASRGGELLGCWFSTSGILPQIFTGLEVDAFGDFPGVLRVQKVEISPDHGITRWPAEQVEGKGYRVKLPFLPAGSYGLEWGVWSKDKHNRLILVIIPINWDSERKSAAANHLMVQAAPTSWQEMPAMMIFAHLRGFVAAWATPDLAVLGAEQALKNMQAPLPAAPSVPSGVAAPAIPECQSSGVQVGEGQVLPDQPAYSPPAIPTPTEPTCNEPKPAMASSCLTDVVLMLKRSECLGKIRVRVDVQVVKPGVCLRFWRGSAVVLEGEVAGVFSLADGCKLPIPDAPGLRRGDQIAVYGGDER